MPWVAVVFLIVVAGLLNAWLIPLLLGDSVREIRRDGFTWWWSKQSKVGLVMTVIWLFPTWAAIAVFVAKASGSI